jgi:hypothetical protein
MDRAVGDVDLSDVVPVPSAPSAAPPDDGQPAAPAARDGEQVLFRDRSVTVTVEAATLNFTTYPLATITAVEVQSQPRDTNIPFAILGCSVCIAVVVTTLSLWAAAAVLAAGALVAVGLWRVAPQASVLRLITHTSTIDALMSNDPDYMHRVATALRRVIEARPQV